MHFCVERRVLASGAGTNEGESRGGRCGFARQYRHGFGVQNDLSLEVRIMNSLALALGYSVRYNSAPPPGFEHTDTLTTLNLVYELK
jgi:hypothetical protein